jgi:alkylated DNA repair dioxygenase AlkB
MPAEHDILDLRKGPVVYDIADGALSFWPSAFSVPDADALQAELLESIDWRPETLTIFGRPRQVPRLVAWHGDRGARYTYSGVLHEPRPWLPVLERIRARVSELTAHRYNAVLLNRYRDGRDAMAWHADDEPELGDEPVIASVSFGATRGFRLRHRATRRTIAIDLSHGSLLVMSGPMQQHWLHSLPRTTRPVGERINLTFRWVRVPGLAS